MKSIMLLQKSLPPFIVQAFKTKTASHISRSLLFSRPSIDLKPHSAHFHLILCHTSLQLSKKDLKTTYNDENLNKIHKSLVKKIG